MKNKLIQLITIYFFILSVSSNITFLAVGDWGSASENNSYSTSQKECAKQMAIIASKNDISFILNLGDNFYENGVQSVNDPLWKTDFTDIYSAPSLQVPWLSVLGNHDWRGNWKAQIEYSQNHKNWVLPSNYYSYDWKVSGDKYATFVMLDTTPIVEQKPSDYKDQILWLDKKLASISPQGDRWVFVAGHHYIESKAGVLELMDSIVKPILDKYNVTVYFAGHKHSLEYLVHKSHFHHIISGAGSRIDPKISSEEKHIDSKSDLKFYAQKVGFVLVDLSPQVMKLTYYDIHGNNIYSNEVKK